MTDNIIINKQWQDNEVILIKIKCYTSIITAETEVYVVDYLIDDLIYQIEQFLDGKVEESFWESGERGDFSTTCASLRFLHKDRAGHVLIEVFMELDDGGKYSEHNCCFYINTEIGLLTTFCKKLPRLKHEYPKCRLQLFHDIENF